MLSSLTLLFPKRRRSKENQPLQLKTTHFTALGQVSSRTEPWPVLGQKQSPCAAQTIQQGNSSSRSLIQKFSFCFASNARRTNPTSALKNHGMRVLISGRQGQRLSRAAGFLPRLQPGAGAEEGTEGESCRAEWGAGRAGWRRPGPRAPAGRQDRGRAARKNASWSRSPTGKPPRAPLGEAGGGERARCQPGAPAAARAGPSPSGAPSPLTSLLHSPASELSCSHSLSPFMVKQLCLGEAFPRVGRKRWDSAAPPFISVASPGGHGEAAPGPDPAAPPASRPGAVVPFLAPPEVSRSAR